MNDTTPRLENWFQYGLLMHGEVYDDFRFDDGAAIITGRVRGKGKEFRGDRPVVSTRRTTYVLGKPHEGNIGCTDFEQIAVLKEKK